MAAFITGDEVIAKVKEGEALENTTLSELDLSVSDLRSGLMRW